MISSKDQILKYSDDPLVVSFSNTVDVSKPVVNGHTDQRPWEFEFESDDVDGSVINLMKGDKGKQSFEWFYNNQKNAGNIEFNMGKGQCAWRTIAQMRFNSERRWKWVKTHAAKHARQ
jgi:hypothetical protein